MRVPAYHGGDAVILKKETCIGKLEAIEHTCLEQVVFNKKIDAAASAGGIVDIVFNGVKHHGCD